MSRRWMAGGYPRLLTPHRRPYRTADGFLCVLIYNDRHWQSFLRAVEREDLLADPRFASHGSRTRHIDAIYAEAASLFTTRTTAAWIALLDEADIPYTPMHDLPALLADPHLQAVGFFQEQQHPAEGTVRSMKVASSWSASQPEPSRLAPLLGQHTREVLAEAGFAQAEIDRLMRKPAPSSNTPRSQPRRSEEEPDHARIVFRGASSPGSVIDAEWRRTVTEADNVLFSSMTMNVARLHLDAEYMKGTEFGRPLVNSLFTLGLMIGMSVHNTTNGTAIANLGMNDVRFPAPVFAGDTLRVLTTVKEVRASRSRADAGIVTLRHEAFNQADALVATCERAALVSRRPAA
jgi:acyl dehydratase